MNNKRAAASARAYLHFPFDIVVDMLSLVAIKDWHWWIDSDNNTLRICKDKVIIVPGDSSNKTNDIFRKTQPITIFEKSYWGILLESLDSKILILLGNDGRLRCLLFKDDIWQENFSPLLLGIKILRYIAIEYLESDIRNIQKMKVSYPKDFQIEEAIVFGIPITQKKLQDKITCLLKNQNLMD